MNFYNVQVTTDLGETIVLQVAASSTDEAELTAINMVELGQADTNGQSVIDCFVC